MPILHGVVRGWVSGVGRVCVLKSNLCNSGWTGHAGATYRRASWSHIQIKYYHLTGNVLFTGVYQVPLSIYFRSLMDTVRSDGRMSDDWTIATASKIYSRPLIVPICAMQMIFKEARGEPSFTFCAVWIEIRVIISTYWLKYHIFQNWQPGG